MGRRITYWTLPPKRTPFQTGTDRWPDLWKAPTRRRISHTHPVWLWGHSSLKISSLGWVLHGTKWLLWRPTFRNENIQSQHWAHSLTLPWSWALLEEPPIAQLLRNFPTFHGTRRFISVFTRALHWSLSWAWSIQSISSHPIPLWYILKLFTHLRLGLHSGLFPSGFPTTIPYAFLFSSFVLHALSISSSLTWSF
jgi:hypothetical protein